MALRSELMAGGLPAQLARAIGLDSLQAIVPAGTNQATAILITSPAVQSAATGSGTGVLLPVAENKPLYFVRNVDGANALLVYPNGSETINGSASFSITAAKMAIFIPLGKNWLAMLGA